MKIVFAVEGTRGDVHPMLALASRLQALGHEALICAPPEFAGIAQARGFAFRSTGGDVRGYLVQHAAVLTSRGPRGLRAQMGYIAQALERQFATLPEVTAGADLILGAGVQLAAASAAELHGVPYRFVAYCPALMPSAEYPPALLGLRSPPRWVNRVLWWAMKAGVMGQLARFVNRAREPLGLARIRDGLAHFLSERPILAADELLAPLPGDTRLRPQRIAYPHDVEAPALPEKLAAFLDAGPPPVYFGFGSMTDARPADTTRMLIEGATRSGFRALISRGWAGLAQEALPEGVMSVGGVSHERLFPRVAAIVHHGGAGTTTAAARAGVPQLVVPHLVDQYYWAERVAELGLGPRGVARATLTADRLADTLAAFRDNDVLRQRAREIGAHLRAELTPEQDAKRILEAAAC